MRFLSNKQLEKYEDKVKQSCEKCALAKACKSNKMIPDGSGELKTLIIGDYPGEMDDKLNQPFMGNANLDFKQHLRVKGFDPGNDFWFINAINCRKIDSNGGTAEPSDKDIKNCRPYVQKVIEDLKPKNIILLGDFAVKSVLGFIKKSSVDMFRGSSIPDHNLKAWIHTTMSPRTIDSQEFNHNLKAVYLRDLDRIFSSLDNSFVEYPIPKIECIYNFYEIVSKLKYLLSLINFTVLKKPIYIDYETTGLKPYARGHKIVSISIYYDFHTIAFPYQYRDVFTQEEQNTIKYHMKKLLSSGVPVEAHNMKFEDSWSKSILKISPKNWKFDTQLAAHILDNRPGITGLKHQVYRKFGIHPYNEHIEPFLSEAEGSIFNRVDEIPLKELLLYNGYDSHYGAMLSILQKNELDEQELWSPYNFFHEGTKLMSSIQEKGICVDEDYYINKDIELEMSLDKIYTDLMSSSEAKKFKDYAGKDIDLASGNDLKKLFYEILDCKKTFTKKGNLTVDKISLEKIDSPFIKQLLYMRKLEKAKGTYFAQFQREIYNGKINPFFDLTIPVSYRSSSQAPNFQNIPTRDPEIKKLIRSGVKASPGRQLLFFDGSGMEVRTSVCYHKDPNMIKYVTDPTTDMHRDTAADIWMLPQDEVTKDIRFYAKNQWVFAQFYGSYYVDCGNTLWETCIHTLNLKTKIGMPLKEHLISKGIKTNAEFLEHCKSVENIFWKERFKVYDQWKKDINAEYQKNGVIYSLMGFPYRGIMNRKQVSNFPIQGTAFHLLLWTLLELNKVAKQKKWKSWINGQIHDEGILDAIPEEIPEIVATTNQIVGIQMRKTFDWINVPFEMEFAVTPLNGSWYDKGELK